MAESTYLHVIVFQASHARQIQRFNLDLDNFATELGAVKTLAISASATSSPRARGTGAASPPDAATLASRLEALAAEVLALKTGHSPRAARGLSLLQPVPDAVNDLRQEVCCRTRKCAGSIITKL
jgi:hypothetical protein